MGKFYSFPSSNQISKYPTVSKESAAFAKNLNTVRCPALCYIILLKVSMVLNIQPMG